MPIPSPTAALIKGVATSTAVGTDAFLESTTIADLAADALLMREGACCSVDDIVCNGIHLCNSILHLC
uniref:Uncharacterized protein n=1 Tax=Plectus sambesii TaxID=2011161 RepID=A0A914UYV5_9BILA